MVSMLRNKQRMRRVWEEREGEMELETNKGRNVRKSWKGNDECYLPGLQTPCRLLPPAFSSRWSSWRRAVTWLHLGDRSRRRQLVSVQTLWDKTARGQGHTYAIDYYNDTFYWHFTSRKIGNKMSETEYRKANVSKGFNMKETSDKSRNLMCLSLVWRERLGDSRIHSCLFLKKSVTSG